MRKIEMGHRRGLVAFLQQQFGECKMRERIGGIQSNHPVEELRCHRRVAKFPVRLRQVHVRKWIGGIGRHGFLKGLDRECASAELFLLHAEIIPERCDVPFGLGFLQPFV